MPTKPARKLRLHRETLRVLSAADLGGVNGADGGGAGGEIVGEINTRENPNTLPKSNAWSGNYDQVGCGS